MRTGEAETLEYHLREEVHQTSEGPERTMQAEVRASPHVFPLLTPRDRQGLRYE